MGSRGRRKTTGFAARRGRLTSAYRGIRDASGCHVTVDRHPLDARLDLCASSSVEFDWGRDCAGAARLAFAILAEHAGDEVAWRVFEQFKTAVVAALPLGRWTLSRDDVDSALAVIESSGTSGIAAGVLDAERGSS